MIVFASTSFGQAESQPANVTGTRLSCFSEPGGARTHCAALTSGGVVLLSSTGSAACILGRSWGYDADSVWVSDGCGGEFFASSAQATPAAGAPPAAGAAAPEGERPKSPEYIPNLGFLLYEGEKGQIYMRLMSYARYLNQKGLDDTYTDSFGNTKAVSQREDFQLNKFFLPFSGWFLSPSFRYYLYVW
jgi:hypothetical protein